MRMGMMFTPAATFFGWQDEVQNQVDSIIVPCVMDSVNTTIVYFDYFSLPHVDSFRSYFKLYIRVSNDGDVNAVRMRQGKVVVLVLQDPAASL